MYISYEILILYQIFQMCFCDLDNFVGKQSQLSMVYMANDDEIEFQLKDRTFNDSIKIDPTKTAITNNSRELNTGHLDKEDFPKVLWDIDPVPYVNAYYAFDQSTVQILLDFVTQPENVRKLSRQHLKHLKKYVYEWFEYIQEPAARDNGEINDELGIQNNHIPKSMGFQDIVLRNILRVQIDLQKIMDYSDDVTWRVQVVDRIAEAEALTGIDIFRDGEIESVSSSFAQLSKTYNLHPFELYSQALEKDSSFLSLAHAALHSSVRQHLAVALEWLEAAKSLLKDDVISVWKDILNQNENLSKSLQTEENYWLKLKTKREIYEREKEEFVKQERAKLEMIFPREENAEVKNDSECRKTGCSKDRIDYIYVDIISKVVTVMHEDFFKGPEILNHYGSFFKSLKEVNVSAQTSKTAKEEYIMNFPNRDHDLNLKIKQDKLCRGIDARSTKEMSMYSCRLDSRNSPYLLLMPVKVEYLNKHPEVMIFHHIIGDKKIHEFQQMALPIADMSKTGSAMEESQKAFMFRKSYVAWLYELISPEAISLSNLVSHLTGFIASNKLNGSELLQVNSYLSGGFYVPHQDAFGIYKHFFDDAGKITNEKVYHEMHEDGDRIATFMIYMNDDMIGGRTVFPHLRLSVAPEKGSAIYWNNLHLNGSIHDSSLHAGCQVLAGIKWVANKWIKSNTQMFRKPCALERNM